MERDLDFSKLTAEQAATLRKHLYESPYLAKFIWLSFGKLSNSERKKAIPSVKTNTAYFEFRHPDKLTKNIEGVDQPNTYEEWIKIYPYAVSEFCTPNWIYETKNFVQPNSGGSRRSLQKSRLVKRKSRKYKSIKKSKKRSFKKRSGRH